MSAERIIGNLLWLAQDDLDDARRLGRDGKRNAAYHLEQAAEKALKAVLVSEGTRAGAGHQLDMLAGQLPDENPMKARLAALARLEVFATTYRYVTGGGRIPQAPPAETIESGLAEVESLIADLAAAFGADLTAKDRPARSPGPIRGPSPP